MVLVASSIFAEQLRERVRVPVHVMHQATDIHRFAPAEPDPSLRSELLFVGNSRGQRRESIDWAIEIGARLSVYGTAWEGIIPSKYVKGTYFPNERLAALYSSAAVVLNDHWPDMREQGFISNRIFDVLACGAFLISDRVVGLDDLFGDAVPTFASPGEMRALIERYGDDPDLRRALANKGMEIVRKNHSFDARAEQFKSLIDPAMSKRALTVEQLAARASRS
jgi:spore maturation protein CgeB